MIANFKVSNFKGFNSQLELNLKNTNSYAFNSECVANGIVKTALVYGYNGSGKSNLGLALFDIVGHLTDKTINDATYGANTYLNAQNGGKTAAFEYEFHFDKDVVTYTYEKTNVRTVIKEKLIINGKVLAEIDRNQSEHAQIGLEGAETLKTELTNQNLSLLKYIRSNSVLAKNHENGVFERFLNFVDGMLFFSSAYGNSFLGLESIQGGNIEEDIINHDNVKNLQAFLKDAGIECELEITEEMNKKKLAFNLNGKLLPFYEVASSGTRALTLFYMWRQRFLEKGVVSFMFIDEFDSYYHHDLAAFIVEELKKIPVQCILTSHNTSIMTNDLLRPDCYFLMKQEVIVSLAKSTSKELREAHNIEKMYKAGTFNG